MQVLQNEEKKTHKSLWGNATLRTTHVGVVVNSIPDPDVFVDFLSNEFPVLISKSNLKGKEEESQAYPRMMKKFPIVKGSEIL